ncbi:MAG: hypothetical protein ACOWYE_16160 [Desulfatiglandales bacterium]
MDAIRYYLPGIILIMIAIIIVAVPELLLAVLAFFVILAGIGALYIGHQIRKSENRSRRADDRFA